MLHVRGKIPRPSPPGPKSQRGFKWGRTNPRRFFKNLYLNHHNPDRWKLSVKTPSTSCRQRTMDQAELESQPSLVRHSTEQSAGQLRPLRLWLAGSLLGVYVLVDSQAGGYSSVEWGVVCCNVM